MGILFHVAPGTFSPNSNFLSGMQATGVTSKLKLTLFHYWASFLQGARLIFLDFITYGTSVLPSKFEVRSFHRRLRIKKSLDGWVG